MNYSKIYYCILAIVFVLFSTSSTIPKSNIGGIGGQAIFDSTAQRFKIKSLEINHYLNAKSLQPGDLIVEIDKVPIHKMSYGEVLKLVQGTVGTPMSLKVIRYNAVEKYYQINRIRVTLDMNPKWWSVPDYTYFNLQDGIPAIISQLKYNGKYSIDSTSIPNNIGNKVFCKYCIKGAYESFYIKKQNGKYFWSGSFIKTDDLEKAKGTYAYLCLQLRNLNIQHTKLTKSESDNSGLKKYTIAPKEVSDISLTNLTIDVSLKKEFDKLENKDMWKVELNVNM